MRIERQPQWKSADMREDLRALVVGCKKPHDLAMPRTAIKMIVAVEDDVFGPFEFIETDILGLRDAVVEGIG